MPATKKPQTLSGSFETLWYDNTPKWQLADALILLARDSSAKRRTAERHDDAVQKAMRYTAQAAEMGGLGR